MRSRILLGLSDIPCINCHKLVRGTLPLVSNIACFYFSEENRLCTKSSNQIDECISIALSYRSIRNNQNYFTFEQLSFYLHFTFRGRNWYFLVKTEVRKGLSVFQIFVFLFLNDVTLADEDPNLIPDDIFIFILLLMLITLQSPIMPVSLLPVSLIFQLLLLPPLCCRASGVRPYPSYILCTCGCLVLKYFKTWLIAEANTALLQTGLHRKKKYCVDFNFSRRMFCCCTYCTYCPNISFFLIWLVGHLFIFLQSSSYPSTVKNVIAFG